MKYDLTNHSLIEDNGDLIASFHSSIPSGRAFQILDHLNDGTNYKDLCDIKDHEYDYIKKENEDFEDEVADLKDELSEAKDDLKKLNSKLDDIYDLITKIDPDMIDSIKAICLR